MLLESENKSEIGLAGAEKVLLAKLEVEVNTVNSVKFYTRAPHAYKQWESIASSRSCKPVCCRWHAVDAARGSAWRS